LSDPDHFNLYIYVAFNIYVAGIYRHIKFGMWVKHIKFQGDGWKTNPELGMVMSHNPIIFGPQSYLRNG